jgi:hypothetical protein
MYTNTPQPPQDIESKVQIQKLRCCVNTLGRSLPLPYANFLTLRLSLSLSDKCTQQLGATRQQIAQPRKQWIAAHNSRRPGRLHTTQVVEEERERKSGRDRGREREGERETRTQKILERANAALLLPAAAADTNVGKRSSGNVRLADAPNTRNQPLSSTLSSTTAAYSRRRRSGTSHSHSLPK